MTGKVHEILSRLHEARGDSIKWVFWHKYWSRKQGKWVVGPYNDRRRMLERLIREAGVKRFTFHCLRHHGASTLDNAGVPIGVTQKLLGHEQRQITELYLHSISGSVRAAMEIFEEIRSKSHINPHIKDETHPEQVS